VPDPTAALAGSVAMPLWLDTPARPVPRPPVVGDVEVDLAVVGAGFTGLWTALRAVERAPDTRVIVLEADRIAEHATGRNGGFCEASLTHGEPNGRDRWPEEYDVLHRLGIGPRVALGLGRGQALAGLLLAIAVIGMAGDRAQDGADRAADREPGRAAEDLAPDAHRS